MNELIANLQKHDFEFISEIGSGGFGEVVKARHNISKQFYAIKRLKNSRRHNPEDILREIRAIASFNHPNVISYNYSFIEDNDLYLVMEFCAKGSLRNRLEDAGFLKAEVAVDVFLKLTEAFAFLHKRNFIHHDIKPDNILFTDETIKISDFGTVNTSIGTIVYSAPEMMLPDAPVNDPRVDVFSLGLTFMECVTGINPLRTNCSSWEERDMLVKNADFPLSSLPYWLQQLLLKACNYDPSARFQSMEEFHEALENRHIPQIITSDVIESDKHAQKLKMLIVGHRWTKAKNWIENMDDNSINFLIQKGKYYLGTHQIQKAKEVFEQVLKKDRSAPIEKSIAEIYLQQKQPSKAATILQGYINKHFNNIEAHNQLLHTYFLSDQWELGLNQAGYLREMFLNEPVFFNNHILFKLLLDIEPVEEILLTKNNPVGFYNYGVVTNNSPSTHDNSDKQQLKSKLLFYEFRFNNLHKSNNMVSVEINGELFETDERIISFGRKGYNQNTFSPFEDNLISRRHFLIVNQKDNVWLYDFSTLGTYVDGTKVNHEAFLLGRHEIKFGQHKIIFKSKSDLLI